MARTGRFITLEGGEGVGKSTLLDALAAFLVARGEDVLKTREPGGAPGAEALRAMLLAPPEGVAWSPMSEALLFSAARNDHLERTIRPALEAGRTVICDRFADSTRAYQAAEDPELVGVIDTLERMCVGAWEPDLTFILDLPVEIAQSRLRSRGRPADVIEARDIAFHERVRQGFLGIARNRPWRCVVLDASLPEQQVAELAIAELEQRFRSAVT